MSVEDWGPADLIASSSPVTYIVSSGDVNITTHAGTNTHHVSGQGERQGLRISKAIHKQHHFFLVAVMEFKQDYLMYIPIAATRYFQD